MKKGNVSFGKYLSHGRFILQVHQQTPRSAPFLGQKPTPTVSTRPTGQLPTPVVSTRPTPTLPKKPSPLQNVDLNANSGTPEYEYGTDAQKEAIKKFSDKYTNVCRCCGGVGHWKSECPSNPKNIRKNEDGGANHPSFEPPQVSKKYVKICILVNIYQPNLLSLGGDQKDRICPGEGG